MTQLKLTTLLLIIISLSITLCNKSYQELLDRQKSFLKSLTEYEANTKKNEGKLDEARKLISELEMKVFEKEQSKPVKTYVNFINEAESKANKYALQIQEIFTSSNRLLLKIEDSTSKVGSYEYHFYYEMRHKTDSSIIPLRNRVIEALGDRNLLKTWPNTSNQIYLRFLFEFLVKTKSQLFSPNRKLTFIQIGGKNILCSYVQKK